MLTILFFHRCRPVARQRPGEMAVYFLVLLLVPLAMASDMKFIPVEDLDTATPWRLSELFSHQSSHLESLERQPRSSDVEEKVSLVKLLSTF